MYNIQLVDTQEGGNFVFDRNDCPIDEGLYSEMYACMFGTSSPSWWGDRAFNAESTSVASRTENALKTNNSTRDEDLSLIYKAVIDDLTRLVNKNPVISIQNISLTVYGTKALEIIIKVTGKDETFNYIYNKTEKSLNTITGRTFCPDGGALPSGLIGAGSNVVGAGSNIVGASGGRT